MSKKPRKKTKKDRILSFAEMSAADAARKEFEKRRDLAASEMKEGVQRIQKIKEQFRNATREEHITGRVAEEMHAATANANARIKGDFDTKIKTSSSSGKSTSSGDIFVDGKPIAEVKFHKSATRNAAETSKAKYEGQQRIVPKEHAADAKKILNAQAKKNVTRNPEKAKLRAETADNITDRVSIKRNGKTIESEPLSLKDAKQLKNKPSRALKKTPKTKLTNEMASGAMGGAVMGAAFSAASNAKDVWQGKKKISDAAQDVAMDGIKSGAKAAANIAISQGVKQGLGKVGLSALGKGSTPVLVAATAIETAGDIYDYYKGNIDGGELTKRAGKNVGATATGFAGAKAGALIGAFAGPAGAVVGGVAGGILGAIGFSKLFD